MNLSYHYWPRAFINQRLHLSVQQSYRLIPVTPSGKIRSDFVLGVLNRCRVGIEPALSALPSDLLSSEDVLKMFPTITDKDLRRWTKRKRSPLPHFRFNQCCKRFSKPLVEDWLYQKSCPEHK